MATATPVSNVVQLERYTALHSCPYTMHAYFEILYIRKGSLDITIDNVTVTLHPGDIALVTPFVFQKSEAAPNIKLDILRISPYICPDAAATFKNCRPLRPYLKAKEQQPLIRELIAVLPEIISSRAAPHAAQDGQSASYTLVRDQCGPVVPYLSVLLMELSKAMPLVENIERNSSAMQKVLKYCTDNFNQEITRQMVSRECNVSMGVISQIFNRLGTSFRDYINTLRIDHAYQLLTSTKKPITEIIYECGYANQGTFNRNFQLHFGKSPRDIRHGR